MELLVFTFLSHFAAGIVFITREADLQIIEANSTTHNLQHPALRLVAGMIMLLLWPAFMFGECFELRQSPMAVRIDVQILK